MNTELEMSLRGFEELHRIWMDTEVYTESGDRARTRMLRGANRHADLRQSLGLEHRLPSFKAQTSTEGIML